MAVIGILKNHNLSDFNAVLAIARGGSFRAAALDLRMSTSALSTSVAKLEGKLEVRLFNRTTRSVALTGAGHRFIDQMTPALKDIHQALDTDRSQRLTPSGTVKINSFATAGREILAPLVIGFVRRFPEVHIDIVAIDPDPLQELLEPSLRKRWAAIAGYTTTRSRALRAFPRVRAILPRLSPAVR